MDEVCSFSRAFTIRSLPPEILLEIFKYLTFSDIECVRLVCKQWADIVDESYLWPTTLNITSSNIFEISEDFILQRLEARGKLENICFNGKGIPKIIDNYGKNVRSLIFKLEGYFEIVNYNGDYKSFTSLSKLQNLKSLELYLFKSSKALELDLVQQYMEDIYNLWKDITQPLEEIRIQSPCDYSYFLPFLQRHAESFKSVKLIGFPKKPLCDFYVEAINLNDWVETFHKMSSMKRLRLSNVSIGSFDVINDCNIIHHLQELNIGIPSYLKDDNIEFIVEACPNLKILKIYNHLNSLTDRAAVSLKQLLQLKVLHIPECGISNEGVLNILTTVDRNCLQELNISGLNVNENCICTIAKHLLNLRTLDIGNCREGVTKDSLRQIFRYQIKLRVLRLHKCHQIYDYCILGESTEFSIMQIKGLQSLDMSYCNITDETISNLILPELRCLKLNGIKKLSIKCFTNLANNCEAIEKIDLKDTKLEGLEKMIWNRFKRFKPLLS